MAGWDSVGAIAVAAGAVVWDRPGAWVRPYADAGGSGVAFILAGGGDAGWAAVAAVAFDERVKGLARGEGEDGGGGEEEEDGGNGGWNEFHDLWTKFFFLSRRGRGGSLVVLRGKA